MATRSAAKQWEPLKSQPQVKRHAGYIRPGQECPCTRPGLQADSLPWPPAQRRNYSLCDDWTPDYVRRKTFWPDPGEFLHIANHRLSRTIIPKPLFSAASYLINEHRDGEPTHTIAVHLS